MPKLTILLIDDEHDILFLLSRMLKKLDVNVITAGNVKTSLNKIQTEKIDICLTDLNLPDGDGFDIIQHVQSHCPELPIAVITAYGSVDTATKALKAGAFDYLTKPVQPEQLASLIAAAKALKSSPSPTSTDNNNAASETTAIIGSSDIMQQLKHKIAKIARSQAPVFIHGESGTGKELVANTLHQLSSRHNNDFIAINCGAISPDLVESELFGHLKGSFTGAANDRLGVFRAANGGTLFLDEIGDLPLSTQVKLLRVIQEKQVRPVGSDKTYPIDIRILSASHKDLEAEITHKRFRQDLFYRLNVIQLNIPTLAERGCDDIIALSQAILARIANEWDIEPLQLSLEAEHALCNYPFPGNVRELENILQRAISISDGTTLSPEHLQLSTAATHTPVATAAAIETETPATHESNASVQTPPSTATANHNPENTYYIDTTLSLEQTLEDLEKQLIITTLEKNKWNRTKTAKILGLSFRSLRYRLKKLGLDDD